MSNPLVLAFFALTAGIFACNVLPNPSFENGTVSPDGWVFLPNGGTGIWDDTVYHSGQHSLKLSGQISENVYCYLLNSGIWQTEDFIPLDSSELYEFTAWHKGETQGIVKSADSIKILYFDANGQPVPTESAPNYPYEELYASDQTGGPGWQQVMLGPIDPPTAATKVKVRLEWGAVIDSGVCPAGQPISHWYDDVSLEKIP